MQVDKILKTRTAYIVYFDNGKMMTLTHERFNSILNNDKPKLRQDHVEYWKKKVA